MIDFSLNLTASLLERKTVPEEGRFSMVANSHGDRKTSD
jgi:hypothetical protein